MLPKGLKNYIYDETDHVIMVNSHPCNVAASLDTALDSCSVCLMTLFKHKIQSTLVSRTLFNWTPLPSNTNCQGTEFLHCNVLCFTSIIKQPLYPTMAAKF